MAITIWLLIGCPMNITCISKMITPDEHVNSKYPPPHLPPPLLQIKPNKFVEIVFTHTKLLAMFASSTKIP